MPGPNQYAIVQGTPYLDSRVEMEISGEVKVFLNTLACNDKFCDFVKIAPGAEHIIFIKTLIGEPSSYFTNSAITLSESSDKSPSSTTCSCAPALLLLLIKTL